MLLNLTVISRPTVAIAPKALSVTTEVQLDFIVDNNTRVAGSGEAFKRHPAVARQAGAGGGTSGAPVLAFSMLCPFATTASLAVREVTPAHPAITGYLYDVDVQLKV